MQHPLTVTTLIPGPPGVQRRSRVKTVMAETSLGSYPQLELPEALSGTITGITPTLLNELKSEGVEIGFEGKRYKLARLELDGAFELPADRW